MKIIEIRSMQGPNYWSVHHPQLIVMKLDLADLAHRPTNQIEGFYEKISHLLPSLVKHHCSESMAGNFLLQVQEGTLMGHVIEHLALALQNLAGMYGGFGQTRCTRQAGVYHIIFEYTELQAGLYAAEAAVHLAKSIAKGHSLSDLTNQLDIQVQTLNRMKRKQGLGPSTAAIVHEADRRGIPWKRLDQGSLILLGNGIRQQRIAGTLSERTSAIGVEIARNQQKTRSLLQSAYLPVPASRLICDEGGLKKAILELGYPLAIKPVIGNLPAGTGLNLTHWKSAASALQRAKQVSETVVVEKYMIGDSFRLLVINNQLVAAARRTPAAVTGNGRSTIQQLIELVNQAPDRGYAHENRLSYIQIDEATIRLLQEKDLTPQSILPAGETISLKRTASLSTGGTATDVTDQVHPFNAELAARVARRMGLAVCGIDVIAPSLETPITENGGAILSVQPEPDFRMHLAPTQGQPRNVAAAFIDMLFPDQQACIPIVAVTGTNGKTITTRLIAHLAQTEGYRVGLSTSEGIYLNNTLISSNPGSSAEGAAGVLQESNVDFAVLECAQTGIIDSGLGFRHCQVGIITNIAPDHLAPHDPHTLEQVAQVKSVVVQSVSREGYAVLNADDERVYAMAGSLSCHVALFGLTYHARLQKHCEHGGLAAFFADGYLMIREGSQLYTIEHVDNIPLTFGGHAPFMVQNVLPAVLTAYVQHLDLPTIRLALHSFTPTPEQIPGRMNLFQFRHFQVLVDNAHNMAGLSALGQYISATSASAKIGLIGNLEHYRTDELIEIGRLAGHFFDEVVIRQDKNRWSCHDQERIMLLLEGIQQSDRTKPVKVIPDEEQTIHYLINSALPGSLLIICSPHTLETVDLVRRHKEQEDQHELTTDLASPW